jgi:hypothetical protein
MPEMVISKEERDRARKLVLEAPLNLFMIVMNVKNIANI